MNTYCIHGVILLLLGSEGLSSKTEKIVKNMGFFFIKDWSDNPLSAGYHVVTDCKKFDFNKSDKKKQTCNFLNMNRYKEL